MDRIRAFSRKLPLKNRILLVTIAVLAFWGVACFIGFRWVGFGIFSRQAHHHYRTLAGLASQAAGSLASKEDWQRAEEVLEKILEADEGIQCVYLAGPDGTLLLEAARNQQKPCPSHPLPGKRVTPGAASSDRSRVRDGSFLTVRNPVPLGTKGLGEIGFEVSRRAFLAGPRTVQPIFFAALGSLILVSCLFAARLSNNVTKPILRLTRLADEISQGNLDVNINFGEHVNCWEIKHCRQTTCAAYENKEVQCWFVDGTPCEGYEPRFPQKLGQCRQCEVYQAHKGDEIVQLADSFKHMAYKLKTSQRELERAHSLQRCLIRHSFDGIIASDKDGIILIFNRVAEQLTGFRQEEVIGKKSWRNFFHPDLLEEINKPLLDDGSTVVQGFPPRESVIFRKDGQFIPVWIGGVSFTLNEEDVGRVVFFYDIREIKRLRRDLIQSERMAAVGQTVASISHSIKNILDGLRGGMYIYDRGKKSNEPDKKRLGWEMIQRNIEIISELVVDLLNYSKERQLEFKEYDPNRLIREASQTMERKAESRNIQLVCEGDRRIRKAVFDPFAMHQCLANLISNAIDAIPPDRPGRIVLKAFRAHGDRLCFAVADNGVGMTQEVQRRILKGMFSTKGSKGTGLGLLVVQKIAREHNGTLEIHSEEGKGSEFLISIPYLSSSLPGKHHNPPSNPVARG